MARIDVKNKSIQAKIVYYGPGLCGKTTNLQVANKELVGGSELMSLATEGDMTIFFDFMPLNLKLRDMDVQFKLYTVPGQVRYNQTRKMVLKNVDGVVFVADSQPQMMDGNLESFDNLFSNLNELGINPDNVALILQYNKRDLPNVLPPAELDRALNKKNYPTLLASAYTGEGVVETLKEACRQVLSRLGTQIPDTPQRATTASRKAESAKMPVAQAVSHAGDTIRNGAPGLASRNVKATLPSLTHTPERAAPRPIQPAPGPPAQGNASQPGVRPMKPPAVQAASTALAAQPLPMTSVGGPIAANAIQPITSAERAEEPALEQALREATRLMAELKAELQSLKAERAHQGQPEGFERLARELATKADLEKVQRVLPSKSEFTSLYNRATELATKAELDTLGKSTTASVSEVTKAVDGLKHQLLLAGPAKAGGGAVAKEQFDQLLGRLASAADVKALSEQVQTLRTALDASAQKLAELKAPLADVSHSSGAEIKTIHALVAELIQDVGRLSSSDRNSVNPGPALAHLSQRIGELPTKADFAKLLQPTDQQGSVEVQRALVAELAEQVKQLKVDATRGSGADGSKNADLQALNDRLNQLATKADIERLRRSEAPERVSPDFQAAIDELREYIKKQAPASSEKSSELVTKADLAALGELATKADLQALGGRASEVAPALDMRALESVLSELPRKADLEALQARVESLSQAVAELSNASPTAPAPGAALSAATPVGQSVQTQVLEPAPNAEPAPATAEAPTAEAPAAEAPASVPPAAGAEIEAEAAEAPPDEAAPATVAEAPAAETEPRSSETGQSQAPPAQAEATPAERVAPDRADENAQPQSEATDAEAQASDKEAPPQPEADTAEEKPEPAEDPYADDRQHQNAARVARVMMADLYLYNKEQVDEGIAKDDFYERNKEALADMRLTYESRVKEEIRSKRDYLQQAIDDFIKKKKKQLGIDG